MKQFLPFGAIFLSCALAAPVFAQPARVPMPYEGANAPTAPTAYGKHHRDVREFNSYLDAHPNEAADLKRNPRLVNNPKYLASHPDLNSYLQTHPEVAERYKRHPDKFMHRERRYEHSERRYEKRHHLPPTP